MPVARLPIARAASELITILCARASITTKSLPRPFIFRNGIICARMPAYMGFLGIKTRGLGLADI
jgi:hypothetical protein